MNATPCSVEGCEKPAQGRGWCKGHWGRWRRTGSPGEADLSKYQDLTGQRFGSLVALDRVRVGKIHKWRLACDCGGEVLAVLPQLFNGRVKYCKDRVLHRQKAVVKYHSMHYRTRRRRGPASGYTCAECTDPAKQWSYDHCDPDALFEAGCGPYSLDVNHYEPLCHACHVARDNAHRRSA